MDSGTCTICLGGVDADEYCFETYCDDAFSMIPLSNCTCTSHDMQLLEESQLGTTGQPQRSGSGVSAAAEVLTIELTDESSGQPPAEQPQSSNTAALTAVAAPTAAPAEEEQGQELAGPRLHILLFKRSPFAFRTRLETCGVLEACRMALRDAGFSDELPSGAKLFVHPEQVQLVMEATADWVLRPRHVIVSADYEEAVLQALCVLPRKLGVKLKAKWSLWHDDCCFTPVPVRHTVIAEAEGGWSGSRPQKGLQP